MAQAKAKEAKIQEKQDVVDKEAPTMYQNPYRKDLDKEVEVNLGPVLIHWPLSPFLTFQSSGFHPIVYNQSFTRSIFAKVIGSIVDLWNSVPGAIGGSSDTASSGFIGLLKYSESILAVVAV